MAKLDPVIQRKIMRYCAYQERCIQEVEHKLHNLGCPPRQIPAYLCYLSEEDFLKESRYAELFVRGKVNNNKWGPRKIEMALVAFFARLSRFGEKAVQPSPLFRSSLFKAKIRDFGIWQG